MRIVLFGQAAFGEKVLERLIGRREEVVALCTPPDETGAETPIKRLAREAGVPVFQPHGMRSPGVFEQYKGLMPDLNVLAFVTEIIPGAILDYPRLGSIQYHPSLLPRHRGRSAINWAVIQGETKTGLTIFWVDEGVDTGPILLQKEVEIDPDDTTGSLYFNKLFPMGVDAIMEAVDLVREGRAPCMPQDESQATYEPPCGEAHARIPWSKPLAELYNLVRGCDPQPGAFALHKGRRVQFFATKALPGAVFEAQARPGEVMEVSDKGILVAATGGALLVKKVRAEGEGKMDALELARKLGIEKGSCFD
ncbi:MAG: methionyl-tRNA formyltransferase [Thermodesulfobacteriota bacterium]